MSDDIKTPWRKENLNDIYNLVNNQTLIVEDPDKYEPVTPCMDVYKANIKSNGLQDKPKLIIVVRGDRQNKELVGYY